MFATGTKACETHRGKKNYLSFTKWLTQLDFTYVLDGANIGYTGQNYSEGQFRYEQIEAVRAAVKRSSLVEEDPLIILPSRYAVQDGKSKIPNKARCSKPGGVTVDAKGLALLDSWQESGRLWVVPNESNDDWYWLLAVGSSVRTSGCTHWTASTTQTPPADIS